MLYIFIYFFIFMNETATTVNPKNVVFYKSAITQTAGIFKIFLRKHKPRSLASCRIQKIYHWRKHSNESPTRIVLIHFECFYAHNAYKLFHFTLPARPYTITYPIHHLLLYWRKTKTSLPARRGARGLIESLPRSVVSGR